MALRSLLHFLVTKFSISEHMSEVTTKNKLSSLSLSSYFIYTAKTSEIDFQKNSTNWTYEAGKALQE
jgi:hypothetical protein